jgi:hypothetical protein
MQSAPRTMNGRSEWDRQTTNLKQLAQAYGTTFPLPDGAAVPAVHSCHRGWVSSKVRPLECSPWHPTTNSASPTPQRSCSPSPCLRSKGSLDVSIDLTRGTEVAVLSDPRNTCGPPPRWRVRWNADLPVLFLQSGRAGSSGSRRARTPARVRTTRRRRQEA